LEQDFMRNRQPVVEQLDPIVVESLRRMTPAERLARAFEMWDFATEMMTSVIRQEHPQWSTEQIQREIFRRVRGFDPP
jgi:hypothetical protein